MNYRYKEPSTSDYDLQTTRATPPQRNRLAVIALVCSLVGFLDFGLFAVAGIFLGSSAKKEISSSYGAQTGEKIAKWAVIVGVVALITRLMIGFYLVTQGYATGKDGY